MTVEVTAARQYETAAMGPRDSAEGEMPEFTENNTVIKWACGPVGLWAGLWACGPVGLWAVGCRGSNPAPWD